MDTFRQLKRIFTWTMILLVAVAGYHYWDNIKPVYDGIVQKYNDLKEVADVVDSVKEEIAGVEEKEIVILTDTKEIKINVEISKSEEERKEGLMYRNKLCENCGMLFLFPSETESGFWMKNCRIALDIMFLDKNGKIIDIKKDFKPCYDAECPSYSPDKQYLYAIEVNSGWTDSNKVEVGDIAVGITSGS